MTPFSLRDGVFSRIYRWPDETIAIAYHTPSRSASLFEGDSAEVWWRLYEDSGDPANAWGYILENGTFTDDYPEILAIMGEFRSMLEEANLVIGAGNRPALIGPTTSIEDTVNPDSNPEQRIGQIMADRHICYSLVLETTYRCNEKCVHCYLPDVTNIPELTLDQIDALFGEFHALGGFQVQLTGGEVGVRKDFAGILDLVAKYGFAVSITSNLTRFSDAVLDQIIALKPKSVSCSIYSARPELHDEVTRLRGSFVRSLASIRRLRAAGVPVAMKTPLMKHTVAHWREVEALAEQEGCGFQMDLNITAKNDGGDSPLGQRVTDPALLNDVYRSGPYRITLMNEPLQEQRGPDQNATICGAGAGGLTISPNGDIRPCIGISEPLGRYPQQSLTEVWQHSPFFARWAALTLKDVPCGRCANFQTCSRCPGAWHAEHGSYTQPTDYNCFLARAWSSASQAECSV
jgi:radical SAM protein with 4Fe4S-binding SPASM domain